MKKNRVIIPALGLIALGTAASITGTVAWFTANNSVKITGMTFSTKVGNNLLVAPDAAAAFADTEFKESLTSSISARLVPTSTVNGVNFFYTTLANDDGTARDDSEFYTYSESAALTNATAAKTAYDTRMNEKFVGGVITDSNAVYGYADYAFYLKATYNAADTYLIMNECNILYNGGALTGGEKAWRVGVFAHVTAKVGGDGADKDKISPYSTAMAAGDNKNLLTVSGATNFTSGKAISAIDAEGDKTPTLGDVTYNTWAAQHIDKSTAAGVKYYKVVIRVWLEGEDNTCYVDKYKELTQNYTLSVGFTTSTSYASAAANITSIAA